MQVHAPRALLQALHTITTGFERSEDTACGIKPPANDQPLTFGPARAYTLRQFFASSPSSLRYCRT